MNLGFSELIRTIDGELRQEYQAGAAQWADRNKDEAWSKAVDEFERALVACINRHDYVSAKAAGQTYKFKILALIQEYKRTHGADEQTEFFATLRGRESA